MSELKPGEFVGVDGEADAAMVYLESIGTIKPTHPDFPAAVEALKALVPEPHSCETCVYEAYNDRGRWPCRDCSVLPDREDCWRERGHADE